MTRLAALSLVLSLFAAAPVHAGQHADALAACLADSTTGKDRKDLARWVFLAMAAHPDMRDLSSASDAAREQASQSVGALLTRLLTEGCTEQARLAAMNEGGPAFQAAFGSLGRLAIQELTSNREVNTSLSTFEKYLDKKKIQSAFKAK